MTVYAVFTNGYGHHVVRIEDGVAHMVASLNDLRLAEQIRDYLTHQDRIDVLLARHGLHDVPLSILGDA